MPKRNSYPKDKLHTLINYPTTTIQKCTRCGVIVKTNRDGVKGRRYYKDGVLLKERPDCISQNLIFGVI